MSRHFQLLLCLLGWLGSVGLAQAQRPRLVIPTGQSSRLTEFQFSSNGRYLLTGEISGTIVVWEMATRREALRFRGHQAEVWAIAMAPDGRTVVSGDSYGNVLWWDLATGRLLKKLPEAHYQAVRSIQFSPDGRQLVTAASDGEIITWDVATRTVRKKYGGLNFSINKLVFNADGSRFLCVAPDSSKRDKATNLMYGYATPDSLVNDISYYYSSALLKDACLLPNGRGYAVITDAPAELRLRSLKDEKINTLALPGINPFAIEPLDSTHLLIGARCPGDSTILLRYDLRQQRIVDTVFAAHYYGDNNLLRVVPGTHGQQVAFGGYMNLPVEQFSLITKQHQVLNPSAFVAPTQTFFANNQLYLDGIRRGDLRTGVVQKELTDVASPELKAIVGDSLLYWAGSRPGYLNLRTGHYQTDSAVSKTTYWDELSGYPSPGNRYTVLVPLSGPYEVRLQRNHRLHCTVPKGNISNVWEPAWLDATTLLVKGDGDTVVVVFDVLRKRPLRRINLPKKVHALAALPDGTILVGHAGGKIALYQSATGLKIREVVIAPTERTNMVLKYVPEMAAVRFSDFGGTIYWLDPATLQVRQQWKGHQSFIWGVELDPQNHRAFTTSLDGSIRVWDTATGHNRLGLSLLNNQDWVAFTDDGLFDATPAAMKLMYYVVNDSTDLEEPWKIVELNQLKQRYYQPDLLRIQLGYSTEKLREVPRLEQVDLAPKVAARLVDARTLRISLRNQRGGIGAVSVYLDGAEIVPDARPRRHFDPGQAALTIDLSLAPFARRFYPGRPNELRVVAWNRDHWLSAAPVVVNFEPARPAGRGLVAAAGPAAAKSPPPHLYALVVGTSDYAGTQADLRYASKDAADFAAALRGAAQRLYGTPAVEVSLYNSEQADAAHRPGRVALESWFAGLVGRVQPWDVLVVYLAGHGVSTSGAGSDFYYLTQEATRADAEALADPAVRDRCAISSQELTQWLNRLACRKKVLILDACAAGRAAETMAVAARDVPASQVRALDRLTERTGFYILSGSAADAVSYESPVYGQGLLTYTLLKALKGAALRPDGGEEYADVQRLLQYAVDEVPQLAQSIGGQQKPLYRSPDSQQSFDLGRVDQALKASISLAEPRPVFAAASFLSTEGLFDELGLAAHLNAQLRELTARGRDATLAFTEARDYPGAYRISGTYERAGPTLRLRYVVVRGTERVLPPQVFEADFSQPAAFATRFLAQLVPQLRP